MEQAQRVELAELDPMVEALFGTLQQSDCDWTIKEATLIAASEPCWTFFELVAELGIPSKWL
jgi:hypothetical protein